MKICPACQATYPDAITFCTQDGAGLNIAGTWAPGALIRGRYRILSKIGEGGMGAVYKARHTGFDEWRAIKVLNREFTFDESSHERFKREAYITRKLQHPNAVRVEDIDEAEDGCPFIVMEYIEGESLKRVIQEQGPLPAPRVCALAKQVAAALDAAHRLGMVHRDIKPGNILLVPTDEGETVKVLDFGVARVKEVGRGEEAQGLDLTGRGFVVGTPLYISPEQAQGKRGDDLDGRSDLYSLGIVMYQMLTGDVPFRSDTAIDLLIAHIQKAPIPIRLVRPDLPIPETLANLVMRMLQKKREQRPPSAAALMEDLKRVELGMPLLVSPVSTSTKLIPPTPQESGSALAPPEPLASHTSSTPKPAPPTYGATDRPPSFLFLKRPLIVVLIVGIVGWIWYYTTHRPAAEIARHQAAASDFERKNFHAQAEEEYREAVQINPNDGPLQSALGHVLVEERKWDEAISALRAAIALQPDDPVAHNNLGVALQTVGNVADAIPEIREAIRVQPDYVEAHSNLGHALEKQNDLSSSITEYREVLRLKPDDADAHFHLGVADYRQGNSDGAADEFREAIRLQPGFALAHSGLGGVLYNRGERDAGIEELRIAYTLSPDNPEIRAAYQKVLEK